jgi:hypothetical protein
MQKSTIPLTLFLFLWILIFSCGKDAAVAPVNPPPVDTSTHVTALSISSSAFLLLTATNQQLTVNFTPANTTNQKITWTSSDTTIATVDATGKVTAKTAGTVTIVATSVDNPSIKVTATVTVLKNYDVYVVGRGNSNNWINCALYWKNGVWSELPGGKTVGLNAYAVMLAGSDVYVVGATQSDGANVGWYIPTYWKNGVPVQLDDPTVGYSTYARSIAVSGSTVYVAGYNAQYSGAPFYNGRFRAYYWKADGNTVKRFPLYDSATSTDAFSIALSGNDVFVAGSLAKDNFYRWGSLWKNDFSNAVPLTDGPTYSQLTAVAVDGSDVYVAGYGGCPDFGCPKTARLWKNNMSNVVSLTSGTTVAETSAMTIVNGIVYVCGCEKNTSGKNVAKYWKITGNTVTSFALTDGTYDAKANSIAVVGDDVFIAGNERNSGNITVGKYWRVYNGLSLPVVLPNSQLSGQWNSEANGIFVR